MNPKFLVEVVPTIPSDLVSVKEGAGIARKTERTIWRDIRSGKLRALLAPVAVRGKGRE